MRFATKILQRNILISPLRHCYGNFDINYLYMIDLTKR
jgi:hypothetical protein